LIFGLTTCSAGKESYSKIDMGKTVWLKPFLKFVG